MRMLTIPLVLAAGMATAQTPQCFGANDTSLTISNAITAASFFGPNQLAMQFTPQQTQLVYAASVATGNTFRAGTTMGLEIWSEDPVTGLPQARIAGGSWAIDVARPVGWQGTNFDLPVAVAAGSNYWLVFTEPGFSTPNLEPGGTPVPCARWNYATTSWTPTSIEAKYRIHCAFLDAASVASSGAPCGNTAGTVGTAFTNEPPSLGNGAFTIEGSGFPNGSLAFLVIGFTPGFPSIPLAGFPNGCVQSTLVVDTVGTATTAAGAGGPGHVSFALPIPGQASLTGLVAGLQIAAVDAGATANIPVVTSNAVYITLF